MDDSLDILFHDRKGEIKVHYLVMFRKRLPRCYQYHLISISNDTPLEFH